jgi:hypothetical protein
MGGNTILCRILVGNSEDKRTVRKSRSRWQGNIEIELTKVQWNGVDWIYLA